jgi:hypothetical protein
MVQRYAEQDFITNVKGYSSGKGISDVGGEYDSQRIHCGGTILCNLILILSQ